MKKWLLGFIMLMVLMVAAACAEDNNAADTEAVQGPEPDLPALQMLSNDDVGDYLADDQGMTLYYFKNDAEGKSNCTDDCLANWPAVQADEYEVPAGYDQSDFGSITREDNGEKQLTYKGYPLYYFVKDQASGDVNGEGVKDVWYVVNSGTTFDE